MTARPGDPENLPPGLAQERTELAWTRTAISFAAVGGVILKTNVAAGLTVLAISPPIWVLGRLSADAVARVGQAKRLLLITAGVTAVSLVTLAVALL